MTRKGCFTDADILLYLRKIIHTRKNNCDFGVVPDPPQTPFSRASLGAGFGPHLFCAGGQTVNQLATAERFHDNDRQTFGCRMAETGFTCLSMNIQIIELDLAEIESIGINDFNKTDRSAMVRKTDIADLSAGLLFCDLLFDPKIDQSLPRIEVREHVEQIVIDIICLQTLQFFMEKLVKIGIAFSQILRKFGCQIDLASMTL